MTRSVWACKVFAMILISGLTASCASRDDANRVFNFAHIETSLIYLDDPSDSNLAKVAGTEGMRHLKNHSDRTGYYSKATTREEIARDLIKPKSVSEDILSDARHLLDYVQHNKQMQSVCISEPKKYLPKDFEFEGHMFITWGYDIDVAMDKDASLNLIHKRFREDKEEIWFYCIHEMHHAGVMHFNQIPDLSGIKTGDELFSLVKLLTFLEGTAVYASYDARKKYDALDDKDYRALENPELMAEYKIEYFKIYEKIKQIGSRALNDEDWKLLKNLSSGKRLWYRVGSVMASQIDARLGRTTLTSLIKQGPDAFFETYFNLDRVNDKVG